MCLVGLDKPVNVGPVHLSDQTTAVVTRGSQVSRVSFT